MQDFKNFSDTDFSPIEELDIVDLGEELKLFPTAKIAAIGVGGGGSNTISHISINHSNDLYNDVTLMAANTDAQHLNGAKASKKLQLGVRLTKGLGAGGNPQIGEEAAKENYDEIVEALKGYDVVFIATGLGGGTGTGAAPVIARAAKENGALTISVVTKPASNEGKKRAKVAREGQEKLRKESDCIIIIPNERLVASIDVNMGGNKANELVNDVMANALIGLANIILGGGSEGDINIDLADVRCAMNGKGLAVMNVGVASGKNAAEEAYNRATQLDLLGISNIHGATGILVCLEANPNYPYTQIHAVRDRALMLETGDTDYKFGVYYNGNFAEDQVRITFIAAGFEDEVIGVSTQENKVITNDLPMTHTRMHLRVSGGEFNPNFEDLDEPAIYRLQRD